MATAKKPRKPSKQSIVAFVKQTRQEHAPSDADTVAEAGGRALATIAAYEAAGMGAKVRRLQPLHTFLAAHGTLVVPAQLPWPEADLARLAALVGPLPPGLTALLRQGGLWTFRANPGEEIRTFDLPAMLAARERLVGLLDEPPEEGCGEITTPTAEWAYSVSGVLPPALREGANLLPLAPYYGDHGAYFLPLHLRDERGECPVLLGSFGQGDVVAYGRDVAAWKTFMVRLTLEEIDWMMLAR